MSDWFCDIQIGHRQRQRRSTIGQHRSEFSAILSRCSILGNFESAPEWLKSAALRGEVLDTFQQVA